MFSKAKNTFIGLLILLSFTLGIIWTLYEDVDALYERSILDSIAHIELSLQSFAARNGHYPDSLEDLWKGRPIEKFTSSLAKDIRGNSIKYSKMSGHGLSRPDVWVEDKVSGKTFSNWSK